MGERSRIEWTDATWNPWHGCTKVSPGCKHCYMYREKKQYGQNPAVVVRSKTTFTAPLKWKEPRRIFTCSWSDFFHETADPWRAEAWDVIRRTPQHTYLILTKRPERIREAAPPQLPLGWIDDGPWPNVWLGVSVETQEYSWRIDHLAQIPAAIRFLSLEPLLGPLNISPWLVPPMHVTWGDTSLPPAERQQPSARDVQAVAQLARAAAKMHGQGLIDWVIVGGESGPGARRMELGWAASLLHQCQAAGVPFFLKQLGGEHDKRGGEQALLLGQRWTEMPA